VQRLAVNENGAGGVARHRHRAAASERGEPIAQPAVWD
jgi:hypothetical protein